MPKGKYLIKLILIISISENEIVFTIHNSYVNSSYVQSEMWSVLHAFLRVFKKKLIQIFILSH